LCSVRWKKKVKADRSATIADIIFFVSRLSPVATCRQTVEALPHAPPPLGSGWLRRAVANLPPVATCRQTVEAFLTRHHRLAADGYEEP